MARDGGYRSVTFVHVVSDSFDHYYDVFEGNLSGDELKARVDASLDFEDPNCLNIDWIVSGTYSPEAVAEGVTFTRVNSEAGNDYYPVLDGRYTDDEAQEYVRANLAKEFGVDPEDLFIESAIQWPFE